MPTDKEREILKLMYDLHIEHLRHHGQTIAGLKHATDGLRHAIGGLDQAIESVERSQDVLTKIMKATGELMGVH